MVFFCSLSVFNPCPSVAWGTPAAERHSFPWVFGAGVTEKRIILAATASSALICDYSFLDIAPTPSRNVRARNESSEKWRNPLLQFTL